MLVGKNLIFGLPLRDFEEKLLLSRSLEKNSTFYCRFRENSMFLDLTHRSILAFSLENMKNLGAEMHLYFVKDDVDLGIFNSQ